MAKLKVGIAGYGVVGKRRRACLDRSTLFETVAVCDRAFPKEGEIDNGVHAYRDYRQLLTQELDVLLVCITNDLAPEVTIAGLEKGLHVFCEKPPGKDVSDVLRVIAVEKSRPTLKLMYGFNHRYHESVQDALSIITEGELGRIINMRGVYGKSKLITFNQPDWRTDRSVSGGGVLLDQGIHMVDLMRLFAGSFTEVYSFISNGHWGYDVEDNAYALMRTDQGVVAMLNSSATQWRHRFSLDINLERGSLLLGGILSGSKSYGAETLTVVWADPDKDNGDPKESHTRYNKDLSWDKEMDVFAEAISCDAPVAQGSSEEALATMRLVYKIYCADKTWQDRYSIQSPDLVLG
jgi:predicted dehydrogenase